MKNEYKNIITSRLLLSCLSLAILYFSQVTPFYHIHHFHQNDLLEFEISTHPVEVDLAHFSEHHHDQDRPHANDHQHTFDNQIDWHIVRTQLQKILSFHDQYIFPSLSNSIAVDENTSSIGYKKPPDLQTFQKFALIIRGPPFLV